MKSKKNIDLPPHLQEAEGLPRNHEERLLWIKKRAEEGYYDSERVRAVTAEVLAESLMGYASRRVGK